MARGTLDPLPGDNRRTPRAAASGVVRLEAGDLTLPGALTNVGEGGAFFATQLLIEVGERGQLTLDGGPTVPVRVVWLRSASHPDGPGMGLSFEADASAFLAAAGP